MTHTTNYNLNKFEAADRVTRDGFNQNADRIDAAIKSVADAAAGGVRIEAGTYTGTGTFWQNNPNSLTFSAQPLLLFVCGNGFMYAMRGQSLTIGDGYDGGSAGYQLYLTWSGNTVSWYSGHGATYQLNKADQVYSYIALLPAT